MSRPDDTDRPDSPEAMPPDEALALEWALGMLAGAARQAAEDRRRTDPAFAGLCDRWVAVLAPLSDEVPPVAPSPGLWARISRTIEADETAARTPAPRPAPALRWWNSLALWRGATAAMAALSLALLLARPPGGPPPQPPVLLAATLTAEGGGALLTAALDPGRREVVLAPVSGDAADGRVPELWLIPADGRPRSLGVIDLKGAQRIAVPAAMAELVADGAVLAVSLEPQGGSPTGAPTGPVVATGTLARI